MVKNQGASAGDIRDTGLIRESERSLEKDVATHSSILAWRTSMDRGAWRATVHMVAESDVTEAT